MVKWIREWTAGVGVQFQVQVSKKKSLDKYELSVRSAVEGVGIRDIQGER